MNLLLLEASEVGADGVASIEGRRARHVIDVLRAATGQSVRVGILDGPVGTATITAIDRARGAVTLACALEEVPPVPAIDLLLALPRPKVLGRLYSVIAQLGARRLMLAQAARVERFYFDAHQVDPGYAREQLISGLEQARDTRMPIVTVHRSWNVLLERELDELCPDAVFLVADPLPGASAPVATSQSLLELGDVLRGRRALLAIGPEGGWNEHERELMSSRGFRSVSLGSRPFRVDVAVTVLLAMTHAMIER